MFRTICLGRVNMHVRAARRMQLSMAGMCLLLAATSGCGEAGPAGGNAGPAAPSSAGDSGPPPILEAPLPVERDVASEEHTKAGIAAQDVGQGVLATPASVYLRIPDRLVFQNIEHAMNLYKAEHGELPKTHDQFMADIIRANNIQLPELPDDSRYVYVPEEQQLMIERRPM